MDRKKLIDTLIANGMPASLTDLPGIKKFIADNGIVLNDADGKAVDVDAVYGKARTVSLPADEPAQKTAAEKLAEARAASASQTKAVGIGNIERKAYEAKAARSFQSADNAEVFAAQARIAIAKAHGIPSYSQIENDKAILKAVGVTYDESLGGATVSVETAPELVYLTEKYGVARKLANFVTIGRTGTWIVPRMTNIPSFTFTAEAGAATQVAATYDSIRLSPKTAICYMPISQQLLEKSAISIADNVARIFAEASAKLEDSLYVNGDGTAAYGNIMGLRNSTNVGSVNGAGGSWSALTLANLETVIGSAENIDVTSPMVGWLCSRQWFLQVGKRLADAQSGNRNSDTYEVRGVVSDIPGSPNAYLLGWPVWFSQQMPTATAGTQKCAIFGDFKKATYMAVGADTRVESSAHAGFSTYTTHFRGVKDIDVNISGDGRGSTYGPLVALATT